MKLVIAMHSARSTIWRWPEWATERLRAEFPEVAVAEYLRPIDQPPAAEDAALFADADAVVAWRLDPALWRGAANLRWIHCPSAAVHQLLTRELAASDIVVTNGASVHAATVAEHALALLLALARGLPQAVRQQANRRWDANALLASLGELAGSTAVIVGMGHIGRALATRLQALEMTVLGVTRENAHQLDALLSRADYVVLALPHTSATDGFFGERQFTALPPGGRLINIGRGAAVDETALLAALASGRLAGAGLDVFAHEPLPADSPLWACEQVLVTPHIAAATPHTWQRQVNLLAGHLGCFLRGETLAPQVDKQRGY